MRASIHSRVRMQALLDSLALKCEDDQKKKQYLRGRIAACKDIMADLDKFYKDLPGVVDSLPPLTYTSGEDGRADERPQIQKL